MVAHGHVGTGEALPHLPNIHVPSPSNKSHHNDGSARHSMLGGSGALPSLHIGVVHVDESSPLTQPIAIAMHHSPTSAHNAPPTQHTSPGGSHGSRQSQSSSLPPLSPSARSSHSSPSGSHEPSHGVMHNARTSMVGRLSALLGGGGGQAERAAQAEKAAHLAQHEEEIHPHTAREASLKESLKDKGGDTARREEEEEEGGMAGTGGGHRQSQVSSSVLALQRATRSLSLVRWVGARVSQVDPQGQGRASGMWGRPSQALSPGGAPSHVSAEQRAAAIAAVLEDLSLEVVMARHGSRQLFIDYCRTKFACPEKPRFLEAVGALIYAADPFHPKAICPGLIRRSSGKRAPPSELKDLTAHVTDTFIRQHAKEDIGLGRALRAATIARAETFMTQCSSPSQAPIPKKTEEEGEEEEDEEEEGEEEGQGETVEGEGAAYVWALAMEEVSDYLRDDVMSALREAPEAHRIAELAVDWSNVGH